MITSPCQMAPDAPISVSCQPLTIAHPGIVFLAGHGSDMLGTKALAIEALADRHNSTALVI